MWLGGCFFVWVASVYGVHEDFATFWDPKIGLGFCCAGRRDPWPEVLESIGITIFTDRNYNNK
jgi:hypothetical protein